MKKKFKFVLFAVLASLTHIAAVFDEKLKDS